MFYELIREIIKGIFIALLYLQLTLTNDTTVENITRFAIFYMLMVYGARLSGVETKVITGAFLTKTIVTLIDERVKRPTSKKK